MKGDFSRSTFTPRKHYSGVLMQQGRVQLDADWNENLAILRHRIETETLDVIGGCGVPKDHAAFGIVTDAAKLTKDEKDWLKQQGWPDLQSGDFFLTRGRAYVDGIMLEVEQTLPFSRQPFVLPTGQGLPATDGYYLAYLDVWERHITALEDPSIREVALGGPDTATRTQVIWQVVAAAVGKEGGKVTCADDLSPWPQASTGTLRARTKPEAKPDDPCSVAPGAGYKRLENQFYRVEVHQDSGSGKPTFKWSRDNGSVVVAVDVSDPGGGFNVDGDAHKVKVTSLGRDDVLGLHENDWVEVLDDAAELAGKPGTLAQITKIDPDNILTLSKTVSGYDSAGHPKLRRWDSKDETPLGAPGDADGYLDLEEGIQVRFDDPLAVYHTGDYWTIAARTVPGQYGDIEWPQSGGDPAALLPFGISHHYCKIAVLTVSGGKIVNVDDCRRKFPSLTDLPAGGNCCCSVSVGQGGEYADIQSAIDARPLDAQVWRVCLMAGEFKLDKTVKVEGAEGLVISGCERQSVVIGPQGEPVFKFVKGRDVQLDGLRILGTAPDGVLLFSQTDGLTIKDCIASNLSVATGASYNSWSGAAGPLIVVNQSSRVEIRDNELFGLPAVQAWGVQINITDNRLTGGGIQIIPPAMDITIESNTIMKGKGPGIQLGGGQNTAADFAALAMLGYGGGDAALNDKYMQAPNAAAGIKLVRVSDNLITAMQGSGIVSELSLVEVAKLGDVDLLDISRNRIFNCCAQPDIMLDDRSRVGGGIALLGVFNARIQDNLIFENGRRRMRACGIFILDGSAIEIRGNQVLENGTEQDDEGPREYQAGIAAHFVFGNLLGQQAGKLTAGYPALRVIDNQVNCPAGQALTVLAAGSVAVDGNTFVSREQLTQPPAGLLDFGGRGRCIYINNLGLPVWLPDFALGLSMAQSGGPFGMHFEDPGKLGAAALNLPDGRVLFHNNQVKFNSFVEEKVDSLGELDGQWPAKAWAAAYFSALIISLDDISVVGNNFEATVPLYALDGYQKVSKKQITPSDLFAYLFKFMDVSTAGAVIRASSNGMSERIFSTAVSYVSNATMMNVTTGNEGTHGFFTNAANPSRKSEANNVSLT